MIIVSGCPRSGTSLMMQIFRSALGESRILGRQFPQTKTQEKLPEWAKYIRSRRGMNDRTRDMNPNGYYEMTFTVEGASVRNYRTRTGEIILPLYEVEQMLARLQEEDKKTICKIVSQGLAESDPRFIDKVVFMSRDPMAVAKSQERLGRNNPMDPDSAPIKNGERQLIRSVQMYNQVTIAAAQWLANHQEIPVHVVSYERLIDTPEAELKALQDFIGEGDFMSARIVIDPSLQRSKPEPIEDKEAEAFAMSLYSMVEFKHWGAIIDAAKARAEEMRNAPPRQWHCFRLDQVVGTDLCKMCRGHGQTTSNLIKGAKKRRVQWRGEPCVQELIEGKTPEESIAANHWLAFLESECEKNS